MASLSDSIVDTEDVLVGGLCRDFTDSTLITGNSHAMGALLLPLSGAIVVSSSRGHWVLGTGNVLWLAPHTAYKLRMVGKVRLRSLHLNPDGLEGVPDQSCMLCVTPLIRELISETAGVSTRGGDRRARLLIAALLEEFRHKVPGRQSAATPRDPRLARICTHILQQLDDTKTLQEWAEGLGCDPRTLHRLFVQELGMSFVQWRQHVRLQTAMKWLDEGKPIFDVAFDLGYQNQSAFTTMFRRNLGMSPSEYAKSRERHLAGTL